MSGDQVEQVEQAELAQARAVAEAVPDPELPVLTLGELGIVRDVRRDGTGRIEVVITPTYSGCPALETIRADLTAALAAQGHGDARISTVLAPAWTTDWLTETARDKLAAYGIAPPATRASGPVPLTLVPHPVPCPQCGSPATRRTSRFGPTACKELYTCADCAEPFEHFRPV